MRSDLLAMAGGDPAPAHTIDPECIEAITAAVRGLEQRGKTPGDIVAALATVSVTVLDRNRHH